MDYVALGRTINKYRRELNLTQGELAEMAGISMPFMGHIERGTRVASLETLVELCKALNVTPNELLAAEGITRRSTVPERVIVSPAELMRGIAKVLYTLSVDVEQEQETPCQEATETV